MKINVNQINNGLELYNSFMQKFLDDNDILMYSTPHEGKSVAERFIRALKSKIYKEITTNFALVI